ncbi:MAG: tripartite tricarboxylate transporter substrate binding protein [Acidovorax sp.]|jgi:tripartite-type tricarboxylate transporter receptor subunit TctC|nr:tripartite tricarboxylate transporter substrate binding protein [Acidovorax sp.]
MQALQRRQFLNQALAATGALLAPAAFAQDGRYPDRAITLLCPWPAGGSTDVTLRAFAESASRHLGQSIIIVNRPGAGGTLGASAMPSTKADGYTITQLPPATFRLPQMQKTAWDPLQDFSYVVGLTGYTMGLVVRHDAPWKTIQEFVEDARKRPGQISYGSTGLATSPHMVVAELALKQKIDLLHIPHKGSADLANSLMGGHIMAASDSSGWAPHVASGRMRLLAVYGTQRAKRFPDAPTLTEAGYGIVSEARYGIVGPKGLDAQVSQRLHDAFKATLDDPKVLQVLEKLDQPVLYMNAAQYQRYASEEVARDREIVKRLNLTLAG